MARNKVRVKIMANTDTAPMLRDSAVRLLKDLFLRRAHALGVTPAVVELIGERGSAFTVAGYDEQRLLAELDSVNAFVFLEDLEQRYSVKLLDVRQLLIDRLADPWPSTGVQCYG